MRIRKPGRQEFFRCHPTWRVHMGVVPDHETRDVYGVTPAIAVTVGPDLKRVEMRVCMTTMGVVFLWDVPMPGEDGRTNSWHESARDAAAVAERRWVCMKSNQSEGMYQILEATGSHPEPKWPELTFRQILELGFGKGRLIDSVDHPFMKKLRGA